MTKYVLRLFFLRSLNSEKSCSWVQVVSSQIIILMAHNECVRCQFADEERIRKKRPARLFHGVISTHFFAAKALFYTSDPSQLIRNKSRCIQHIGGKLGLTIWQKDSLKMILPFKLKYVVIKNRRVKKCCASIVSVTTISSFWGTNAPGKDLGVFSGVILCQLRTSTKISILCFVSITRNIIGDHLSEPKLNTTLGI